MKSLNDSLTEYKKINLNTKSLQSKEKFIQRLRTFELFKWFAKPAEFSPIECTKHGWINLSKDTLKCVVCSNILYYYAQSPLSSFKSNIKTHSTDPQLLIDKHNQNCPWRTLSVPDQFIRVDIYDEEKIYKNFLKFKETFTKCSKLPLLDDVPKLDESSNKDAVFILSSCGWSYREDKDVLECEKCLRIIGLWLYKRDLSNYDNNQDEEASCDSKEKENNDFIELFGNTEPYSEETTIKNLLNKIVNSIEIEQESLLLKNVLSSEATPKKGS